MFFLRNCPRKRVMFLLLFAVSFSVASDDVFDIMDDLNLMRNSVVKPNMDRSIFPSLDSFHENAIVTTTNSYTWIAKVVHSRTKNYPYMCTAVCIYDDIFITASRCIFSLKVKHTSVIYQSKRIGVRAFVFPSKPTIQQFDDIGFIVLENTTGVTFKVAPLYTPNEVKRTDDTFNWFAKLNLNGPFKVVGFVMEKENARLKLFDSPHTLKELPIVIHIDLCWNIYTNDKRDGYHVPCYHSCSLAKFRKAAGKCVGYLGVEGAAVFNSKTKKVLGLAVWGVKFTDYELPVGFSVVNSKVFQEDYACAKKVRNAKTKTGTYQGLCKL